MLGLIWAPIQGDAVKFNLRNRNFLKLLDFTPEEIRFFLDLAKELKAAKYASSKGVRICTVEIAQSRILRPRRIAAHPLYNVARQSKGVFFQATDFESLGSLYVWLKNFETPGR